MKDAWGGTSLKNERNLQAEARAAAKVGKEK